MGPHQHGTCSRQSGKGIITEILGQRQAVIRIAVIGIIIKSCGQITRSGFSSGTGGLIFLITGLVGSGCISAGGVLISASAEEVALDAVSAGVLAFGCALAVAAASLWACVCGVMLMPSGGCPLLLSASVWTEGCLIFDFIVGWVSGPNRYYFSEQCCCDDSGEKEFHVSYSFSGAAIIPPPTT